MKLEQIIASFASLTGDAIGIGYRGPQDPAARFVWVNDGFRTMFGAPNDAWWRNKLVEIANDPAHLADFIADVKPRFANGERKFSTETMCRRADGSSFWASISLISLPTDDEGGRFSAAVYRDLTSLKTREDEARDATAERTRLLSDTRDAQSRLISAINAMPDPIAIWDADFRLVICNDAFAPRLLGRPPPVQPGVSVNEVLTEAAWSGQFVDAIGREEEWRDQAEAALRAGPIRDRTSYTDGRVFRANSFRASNGDTIVVTMDVTELEEQRRMLEVVNREIRHQALHDDLTGLANRRGFTTRMETISVSSDAPIALLQIDLDHFKSINDTIGHAAGDEVLAETARRLEEVAGQDRLVARIGGDEFVVLLVGDDVSEADAIANRLVASLSRPVAYRGGHLRTGASVGVARTPVSKICDILSDVDIALYKAKAAGRSRVATFDAVDRERLTEAQALSDDILRGIDAGEFVPVFQPQVASNTGIAVAAEVLARWHHPIRGVLPPAVFLKQAEELNVLDQIDRQVFETALAQACDAFSEGVAPSLSFNVGRQRVMSRDIFEATEMARAYPGQIAFELLETIFFDEEAESFLMQIDAIRDAGVAIEIDDFGSGRASIVALQKIAPDRLKIDRELVRPMAESEGSRRLVRSIIDMGQALGIGVTAEGVETNAHARILAAYGCDRLQGYNFSKPAPLSELYDQFWTDHVKRSAPIIRTQM